MQKHSFAPLLSMKTTIFRIWVIFPLFFAACNNDAFFHSQYTLVLPKPPEPWVVKLGEPHWQIQWFSPDGQKQSRNIESDQHIAIALPETWTSAVLAWPYWPGHNISSGLFRPCGALFPFDVCGNRLYLSWKAGPDAAYYWELANAYKLAGQENTATPRTPRLPHLFDWPRFRELFETDVLSQEIRQNPWLADWRHIAERTVNSGFDRRRIVPEPVLQTVIPVPAGLWYGSSPFAEPLSFEKGQTPVFPLRTSTEIWISAEGILRGNRKTWIFTVWE